MCRGERTAFEHVSGTTGNPHALNEVVFTPHTIYITELKIDHR
jgi:hypothetical protein